MHIRWNFHKESTISPIFNIENLIEYQVDGIEKELILEQCPIPTFEEEEIEEILDSLVERSIRNRQYEEYLVKWKG